MIEVLLEAERALSFGLLDQAERLYRQASDADPRNSIAVVGLARVALERGDERLALSEAERALTIDGENEAARRMAERLREVRDHRAATAPGPAPATPEPAPATPEPEPATPEPEPATPEPEPATPEPAPAAPEPEPATPAPEPATPEASPEPPAPEPVVPEPASVATADESEATVAPAPTPEPDTAPATAPEPTGRGGFIGWLLRLFGRR